MTTRLAAALAARSRGGPLVFSKADDLPITTSTGGSWLKAALKAAKLGVHGPHTLRHTFCSHLAMRAVAARVIQQLAGHSSLVTTQRYMHLSPGATEAAIALLEAPRRGELEPVRTSARRVETRWRRPPITRQAWLENQRLSLGTPTGNQPIRVRASELGGREADVHGSVRNRLRGSLLVRFYRAAHDP
jgi:hypothetical protein